MIRRARARGLSARGARGGPACGAAPALRPESPPPCATRSLRPSAGSLRAFGCPCAGRATALPLSPALSGLAGGAYLFIPLSLRVQSRLVVYSQRCGVTQPVRRCAPLPLSGSCTRSERVRHKPLRGQRLPPVGGPLFFGYRLELRCGCSGVSLRCRCPQFAPAAPAPSARWRWSLFIGCALCYALSGAPPP